jgi:hypothetical protein
MAGPNTPDGSGRQSDRRLPRSTPAGVPVRTGDIEPASGLHWVAILFRILSGMLVLLMVMQVLLGVTSAVEISYGVLIAEAIRLVIFAGLLWAAGDLADLFVQSHGDLRASRILLGRLAHHVEQMPVPGAPPADEGTRPHGRGDAAH